MNRDPIEEQGGVNLYVNSLNNMIDYIDPLGLDKLISYFIYTSIWKFKDTYEEKAYTCGCTGSECDWSLTETAYNFHTTETVNNTKTIETYTTLDWIAPLFDMVTYPLKFTPLPFLSTVVAGLASSQINESAEGQTYEVISYQRSHSYTPYVPNNIDVPCDCDHEGSTKTEEILVESGVLHTTPWQNLIKRIF